MTKVNLRRENTLRQSPQARVLPETGRRVTGPKAAWPKAVSVMRLERDSFGRVLRAYRERCNISVAELSEETKVNVEIWKALEDNDFSRWPTRIYARSLIRQYAKRVGLDPEEIVNEFCRLFHQGDRRVEPILRECAAVVGHELEWRQETQPVPAGGDRRSDSRRGAESGRAGTTSESFGQKVPQS